MTLAHDICHTKIMTDFTSHQVATRLYSKTNKNHSSVGAGLALPCGPGCGLAPCRLWACPAACRRAQWRNPMNIHNQAPQQRSERNPENAALVVPLNTLDHTSLPLVGGKAANLGELIRAGFPVPPGFCVTTTAYALLSDAAGLVPILAELAATHAAETARLAALAASASTALLHAPIPASVVEAITM